MQKPSEYISNALRTEIDLGNWNVPDYCLEAIVNKLQELEPTWISVEDRLPPKDGSTFFGFDGCETKEMAYMCNTCGDNPCKCNPKSDFDKPWWVFVNPYSW